MTIDFIEQQELNKGKYMDKQTVLNEFEELIEEGNKVLDTKVVFEVWQYVDQSMNAAWKIKIISFLNMFLKADDTNILAIKDMKDHYYEDALTCIAILKNLKGYVQKNLISLEDKKEIDIDGVLDRIFVRFHKVARQLRNRHASRKTLEIEDEYDVQDLLHSLLHIYFDDIRDEEWTPSYAGSSARVDFLLKNEKVLVEVKKTRQGLTDKELGNQLIEDIERYKIHPDCNKLICFVYDPEGRIGNPFGVINDLNSRHGGFARIVIQPNI